MRNGKRLITLMIKTLCIGLTVFLAGCAANPETRELKQALEGLAPDAPEEPVLEAVEFQDRDGGLWLSYNDYRALERNIIAMREYAARLALVIDFYRGVE
jgi:hypothetical protein